VPEPVDLDTREQVLREAMREAGAVALDSFARRDTTIAFKGPQDYLSEVDAAVERLLAQRLLGAFPDDSFLGEEGGGEVGERVWVVDPIDGTANFLRGIGHFCISVGFLALGRIQLGAILNPATDELFFARRGRGAALNGKPIRVASTASMGQASVEIGWSTRVPNGDYLAVCARVLAAGASFRRVGSGALGIAYVADGRQDAYVELHINAWDCLAGLLLVEEAGGRVSDFLAGDGLRRGNPVLVTAPGIADAVVEATGVRLRATAAL
jgi:myo-inositol-1(or 4)-monophosphatase